MNTLEKEFIPYEQALALKELGFDEFCFAYYKDIKGEKVLLDDSMNFDGECDAPLYQQAFRWLYLKLDIKNGTMPLDKEAQESLLKELIDKLSSKHLLV